MKTIFRRRRKYLPLNLRCIITSLRGLKLSHQIKLNKQNSPPNRLYLVLCTKLHGRQMGPQISPRLTWSNRSRHSCKLAMICSVDGRRTSSHRPRKPTVPSRVFQLTCKRPVGSIQERHMLLLDLLEIQSCYSWTVFYCTVLEKKKNSNGLQQTRITSVKVT